MTPSDLLSTLLLAGFHLEEVEVENPYEAAKVSINGEEINLPVDTSYKSAWRCKNVAPYDIGAMICVDESVVVLYELGSPNHSTWEHHETFNTPAEAWDFILNFLEEHPQ